MTSETLKSLKTGDPAPQFTLPSHPAGNVSLQDFKGKKNVILAFYPKDDTPGCTKEMCGFSSNLEQFISTDTEVFGISCDDAASHEKFAGKYELKLPLLADVGGKVGQLYGTVSEGKATANRVLFVIDKQGVIKHIHEGMPDNESLLKIIGELK